MDFLSPFSSLQAHIASERLAFLSWLAYPLLMEPSVWDWKRLKLRRDGVCSACSVSMQAGTFALWSADKRKVMCIAHSETSILFVGDIVEHPNYG